VLHQLVSHYPKSAALLKKSGWKPFPPDTTSWKKGPRTRNELYEASGNAQRFLQQLVAEAKELEGPSAAQSGLEPQLIQGRTKCGEDGLHDRLFLYLTPKAIGENFCEQHCAHYAARLASGTERDGENSFAAFSGRGMALGGGDRNGARSRLLSSWGGGGGGGSSSSSGLGGDRGGEGGVWDEEDKQLQAALRASMEEQHAPARSAIGSGGGSFAPEVICLDSDSEDDVKEKEEQTEKRGLVISGKRAESEGKEKEPADHSHSGSDFAAFTGAGYTLGGGAGSTAKKAKAL